ncbi:MAG: DUF493 domain-containing protein [Porticoccaceae bacterium]|nr:DUF493 domain-containing protein [Porticoccaceae bacterium]
MTEHEKPQIEFPCQYPIKVLGDAHSELQQHVVHVMNSYAPGFAESDITSKQSSKGKWQSITVVITATGKPQLDAIFAALKTSARVKMVL